MVSEKEKLRRERRNAQEALAIKEQRTEIGSYSHGSILEMAEEACLDPEYRRFLEWEEEQLSDFIDRISRDIRDLHDE